MRVRALKNDRPRAAERKVRETDLPQCSELARQINPRALMGEMARAASSLMYLLLAQIRLRMCKGARLQTS